MNVQTLLNKSDESFRQFLLVSLMLHASFFIVVAIKNLLLPSRIIEIPPSVRVDIVALPDKLPENPVPAPKTEQPAAKQEEPKKTAAPPETKKRESLDSLQKAKDAQKKALDKLRAMEAIEKMQKEVAAEKDKSSAPAPTPQYKGNIISSGSSFTGLSRLRVNEYLENLTTQVRDHWVLPQWLSGVNLKAAVVIEIDNRGVVVRREVHTSSGNSIFDSSCLAAVSDASPFEPPPDEVKGALIMIRFPFE